MAFLSVVVNVIDCSGIGRENRLSQALRVLPIIQTSSAYSHRTQKVLHVRSSHGMETNAPWCHSCELVPAVLSPPPCQRHRDNRLRSHPSHLASTASVPTHPPPQSSNVRRFTPTTPPFIFAVSPPLTFGTNTASFSCSCTYYQSSCRPYLLSSKDAVNNQIKNGNFSWLHR